MSQRAILKLDGSLETGFQVTSELGDEGNTCTKTLGHLPANPQLLQNLDTWQQNYRIISNNPRITLQHITVATSHLSQIKTCRRLAQDLQRQFQHWLESTEFQSVQEQLRSCLNQEEAVRILICTPDNRLHKLPWHLWEFVESYSQSEVAFSMAPFSQKSYSTPRKKVRVLAILGSSEGIDTKTDRKMLQLLPNADVKFLVEPSRKKINDLLWNECWDIFFFAGHSETAQNQGRIYINRQDSLTLDELKYSLRRAIKNGLQLAIFNSCDGLGLAYELEQLHLAQLIVMRERVPDKVAHEFLKNFLNAFARGEELYVAAREAREKLQGMEETFPCASWLPIIFQNPTVVPPTWKKLFDSKYKKYTRWRHAVALCGVSMAVTGLVMGLRFFGMLEGLELSAYDKMVQMNPQAYDKMMLQRPQERPDNRFVIIKITDDDLKLPEQKDRKEGTSLSDQALLSVLKKLEQHKPSVIAIDIFRDFNVNPQYKDLANYLQQNNFIGTCFVGDSKKNKGISQPPELKLQQVGYADVFPDPDNIMRRAVISMNPDPTDPCQAKYSLSFKIAETYLKKEDIILGFTPQGNLKLGETVFPPLENHTRGYQKLDDRGHQILINYRSVDNSPLNFIPKQNIFSLKEALSDKQTLNIVQDKIVLIGVNTSRTKDYFFTSYNKDKQEKMPGVILHAQIASQIINAALGFRPLLGVWSVQTEVIWIWAWSLLGGLFVWGLKRAPVYLAASLSVSLIILYPIYSKFFIDKSTWIPFVPAIIVFVITACLFNYRKLNT